MANGPQVQREVVAKNDAYTGILGISLVALLLGCVLLFLDYQRYDYQRTPPTPKRYQPVAEANNAGNQQNQQNNPPQGNQPPGP